MTARDPLVQIITDGIDQLVRHFGKGDDQFVHEQLSKFLADCDEIVKAARP
jgi:hypothetical protein